VHTQAPRRRQDARERPCRPVCRRFTADIDAAIRGDKVQVDALLAALEPRQIVPRIADAAQFAEENLVLLLRHKPSGVELDVSLAWTEFEHEAIAAATIATFGSVKAPMASPADLVAVTRRSRSASYDIVAALHRREHHEDGQCAPRLADFARCDARANRHVACVTRQRGRTGDAPRPMSGAHCSSSASVVSTER
jgi:hypothetical protein